MSNTSFIYRHIRIYRFIMNLLYFGRYRKRFTLVYRHLRGLPTGTRVLELCFGDVFIANYCKGAGYNWQGFDLNEQFVAHARSLGHNAETEDLAARENFPKADICIMMGSFYHFHTGAADMLRKMFDSSHTVILSEPIQNLSSSKGLIGFFGRRLADAGKGHEEFRYTKATLMDTLEKHAVATGYGITEAHDHGKDIVIKLVKKNGRD